MKKYCGLLMLLVLLGSGSRAWSEEVASAEPAIDRKMIEQRIERALESLEREPSLAELQRAALRLADADAASTRGWQDAARWSAVLPIVKLVAEHDLERDEALDRYQDEPDRWGADTDRDYGFQVSAQWNLPELVFNPDEVRVYGALASRASRREATPQTFRLRRESSVGYGGRSGFVPSVAGRSRDKSSLFVAVFVIILISLG